jgi:hypothetical protein
MKLTPFFAITLAAAPALAADAARPLVGDPIHGAKLFEEHCKSRYKTTGLGLFTSDAMNLITDDELYARVDEGDCVTEEQPAKFDADGLSYLDKWDMVAFMRTLHMNLSDFFPEASRYVAKTYTIDEYGLGRIAKAAEPLPEDEQSAAVFTFFDIEGEAGNLTYVPQDPIKLDQLEKDQKAGYLVFLPMEHDGFEGEVGIAMDPRGVIEKMMVHPDAEKAELLNTHLARFEGRGRKGQTQPFEVSGGRAVKRLAKVVFPLYLRAMETVTMYDREENERTWAD